LSASRARGPGLTFERRAGVTQSAERLLFFDERLAAASGGLHMPLMRHHEHNEASPTSRSDIRQSGYEPITDGSGAQIGVYYVGYKK